MEKCPICKEYMFYATHTCGPHFYACTNQDYETTPTRDEMYEEKTVYANDAERAAIKFAEKYQANASWYPPDMIVFIMKPDGSTIYKFNVMQEPAPNYYIENTETFQLTD